MQNIVHNVIVINTITGLNLGTSELRESSNLSRNFLEHAFKNYPNFHFIIKKNKFFSSSSHTLFLRFYLPVKIRL